MGLHVGLRIPAELCEAVDANGPPLGAMVGDLHPLVRDGTVGVRGSAILGVRHLGNEDRLPDLELPLELEGVLLIGRMQQGSSRRLGPQLHVDVVPIRVVAAAQQAGPQAAVAHQHPAHHNASQVGAEEGLDVAAPLGGDPAVPVPQARPHAQPVTGELIGGEPIARPELLYSGVLPRRFCLR